MFVELFAMKISGKTSGSKCPDLQAGLQASMYIGYDLCPLVNRHEHTQTAFDRLYQLS